LGFWGGGGGGGRGGGGGGATFGTPPLGRCEEGPGQEGLGRVRSNLSAPRSLIPTLPFAGGQVKVAG